MTTRASLHGIVDDLPDDLLPIAEVSLARLAKRDDEFWTALEGRAEPAVVAGRSVQANGGRRRIEALRELLAGWDGDAARPPTPEEIETALEFWHSLSKIENRPSIGPANDGGVVFEWEVGPVSVYCYARQRLVEVAAFDSERDIVELALQPRAAAMLTAALLNA